MEPPHFSHGEDQRRLHLVRRRRDHHLRHRQSQLPRRLGQRETDSHLVARVLGVHRMLSR